jgi:hypothetical protein
MSSSKSPQLNLPLASPPRSDRPPSLDRAKEVAQSLGELIRFGAEGYCVPDWGNLVWADEQPTVGDLERHGILRYFQHPLLKTLLLPPSLDEEHMRVERDLRLIASQLTPENEVWLEMHPLITTPRFTRSYVEGAATDHHRAHANKRFLAPEAYDEILATYQKILGPSLRGVVLVFPPMLRRAGITPEAFPERLGSFLGRVDTTSLAIELRESVFLTNGFAKVLAENGVCNVLTTWPQMPPLKDQFDKVPTSHTSLVHLVSSSEHDERMRPVMPPYSALQRREAVFRQQLVDIVKRLEGKALRIFVSDSFEGCSPWSITEMAASCVDAQVR